MRDKKNVYFQVREEVNEHLRQSPSLHQSFSSLLVHWHDYREDLVVPVVACRASLLIEIEWEEDVQGETDLPRFDDESVAAEVEGDLTDGTNAWRREEKSCYMFQPSSLQILLPGRLMVARIISGEAESEGTLNSLNFGSVWTDADVAKGCGFLIEDGS